jgi:hypothetical protein
MESEQQEHNINTCNIHRWKCFIHDAENNYARQKTVSDLRYENHRAEEKIEQEKSIKVKCMVRDLRRESFRTCIYIIHKLA